MIKTYAQFKRKSLKNPIVQREYKKLGPQFSVIEAIIRQRLIQGITQSELAERIGTKQSAISRLESGTVNPSLSLLGDVASALGRQLRITIK